MREAFRRIGAMILALCLLVSILSVAVLAEDGTDITGTIQFTVSGYSGVYDGEAHSISVNVTSPEGASVSYAYPTEGEYGSQNPAFTNAGEYKVAYMIAKESYATQTDIATVAIERADVSDAVKSTLKSNFTYDGNPVQLAPFHEGIESWEMAYCDADGTSLSAAPSDPGSYSVKISGYGANYYAHVDHSFTIDEPEKEIEYSVEGFDVDYDGKPHSISLTVSTEGVTVSYATAYEGPYGETNPSFTEAGMYVVYYKLEKQGYKSEEGSVTSEIHAIDISDDVKATLPGSFTCTGAPVQFNLPTDKIQEWSVEYCQGDLSLESAPSTPGSYTATISGESGNYRASISHSFTIVEAEALPVIQYSVSGYSGYYDGQAHSIVLNIATEGVTATFATSEDGAYTATQPSFTEPGEYTVWFRLEKEGYETVVGSANVTIKELAQIDYTVQGFNGYYDGKAHSIVLNIATEGVTATFATSEDGAYTATQPSFTEPGEYTVWFRLEKEGYETVVGSANVTIKELAQIDYTVQGFNGYYDGKAHTIALNVATEGVTATFATSEDGAYTATQPSFTEPGEYTVWFRLEKEGYETVVGSASVTIMKLAQIDYTVQGFNGYYDGKAHTIALNVATEGVTATFATSEGGAYTATQPSFTEPGEYTVWFRLEKEGYETVTGSASVAIKELAQIEYTVQGFNGYYDGKAHTIALNVATEGVTATFATSEGGAYTATQPSFTEPGEYTVWFRLEKENCATVTGSASVTIMELAQIDYSVQGYNGYYDGQPHSIALSIATEGVSVTYAASEDGAYSATLPSFTETGTYTVWFKLEKENCETVVDSASVTIMQLGKIEYMVSNYSGYYDGKAHTIALNVATEGVSVTYATSEDGAYSAALPSFTETGTYTVWFKLEKENCETVVDSASVTITELGKIDYSVQGYNGYYDGKAHTIALNVTTDGVSVTYATSEDGAYSAALPSFTEPGTYTVWFKLEKENCETVMDSASVTITELGKIEYMVSNYSGYYDGKAHTIGLVTTEGVSVTYATSEDGAYSATLPSFTETGTYTVWFKLEKENCETVVDSASVTIMELGKIEYTVSGYSGYYDGKAHTIALNIATEGATVTYATSGDGAYSAALPSFTDPGTYTVWFKIEKDAHTSVWDSETVTIKSGQIRYTVSDYNGVYDGEGHSITLSVLTPGAKVTYSVDDALALNAPPFSSDKPSFVDAGTFKVLYRIEKHGYETVKGSATVTIEKAEQKLYFEKSVNVLKLVDLDKLYAEFRFFCEQGAGVVTVSSSSGIIQALYQASDPSELSRYALYFSADVETPVTVTATAAETTNYKAATATCVFVRSYEIDASFDTTSDATLNVRDAPFIGRNDGKGQTLKTEELDLTIRPLSDRDDKSLLGASLKLWKKLMDSVGASLIGSMAVDVALVDNQTGMEVHNVSGDLTLMLTGVLQQKYLENYKEMACYAVHLKQDSTTESTTAPTNTSTNGQGVHNDSSSFNMDSGTIDTSGANADGSGVYAGSSGFAMNGGNINTTSTGTSGSTAASQDTNGSNTSTGTSGSTAASQDTNGSNTTTGTSGSTAASQDTNGSNTTTGTSGSTAASQDTNGSNTNAADNALEVNIGLGLNGTGNNSSVYESYLRIQDDLRNPAGSDDNSSASSNEGQLLVQRGDLTLVPTGSLSPTVEFIPCKLTENGVIVSDTFLSPFLLIYGPKEAFSNLLTVRAKDGVFTYDGEGHAVAAEPSIVEGTTLYYSLDLESWQTEAPSFTDVLWNEDGSVGSYQVYVLAENPDCDPAVCSYTVTILPEA